MFLPHSIDMKSAPPTQRRDENVSCAIVLATLVCTVIAATTAHATDACQDYTKLAALPASFKAISRSTIGPATMEIRTDGNCTCNDLPAVQRSLGQSEPDGVNFACEAADPSDSKSK